MTIYKYLVLSIWTVFDSTANGSFAMQGLFRIRVLF